MIRSCDPCDLQRIFPGFVDRVFASSFEDGRGFSHLAVMTWMCDAMPEASTERVAVLFERAIALHNALCLHYGKAWFITSHATLFLPAWLYDYAAIAIIEGRSNGFGICRLTPSIRRLIKQHRSADTLAEPSAFAPEERFYPS